MSVVQASASREWARSWKLVLACFVGFSFFSVMSASIGVFMGPLGREFGWSRTLLSSGVAIASVTTAILSPFFGVLIDRYGSRRVALPGLVATGVAVCAFAGANGSPVQWLALWTAYAVISISVKTTVWTAAVARAFGSSQGLALGITLSGTAAAQAIAPPLVTWLVQSQGWRAAYLWLGCGWGSVTLVLCYLFLTEDRGDRADLRRTGIISGGLNLRQALRSAALQRIALATFLTIMVTIGLLIHQIEVMSEAGFSPLDAAWVAGMAGVAGIAGKLITGALLDKFRSNWAGSVTLALTAIAFALLLSPSEAKQTVAIAMVICGYAAGTALQIGSFLTARHAGLKHFGTVYGVMTSLVALSSGLGPLLAGAIYDFHGSYTPFMALGAAASLLSGLLIWSLPRAPNWSREDDTHAPIYEASRGNLPRPRDTIRQRQG